MIVRISLPRRVTAALLVVLLTACHSWRPTAAGPQRLIATEQPSSVRVTLTGGEVVTLQSPTMRSDSIIGVLGGAVVAVASSDVGWVEVRRFSIWKTIGLVYASTAVASAMGLLTPRSECVGFPC